MRFRLSYLSAAALFEYDAKSPRGAGFSPSRQYNGTLGESEAFSPEKGA
jgi:hypothetical protein